MRFRNQVSLISLEVPADHQKRKMSDLLDYGLITDLNEGGFPFFTPLGTIIVKNVEKIFSTNAKIFDFNFVQLPTVMNTNILEKGQEIGDQFRSKIMHLTGSLKDYHVISSPEMLFVHWGRKYQISHNQLPIRLYYLSNLHRQKNNVKRSLFPQQIKIFGGITLTESEARIDQELNLIKKITTESFEALGLPYHIEVNYNGFNYEFFYLCKQGEHVFEGENLLLPGINAHQRSKAYSLGMIYNYPMTGKWKLRIRNVHNQNKKPTTITFGICTPRVMHCLFENYHDRKGFNLPRLVRPFDICIIPEQESCLNEANELYSKIRLNNTKSDSVNFLNERVSIDERFGRSVEKRNDFADYIGTLLKIVVKKNKFRILHRNKEGFQETSDINQLIKIISLSKI